MRKLQSVIEIANANKRQFIGLAISEYNYPAHYFTWCQLHSSLGEFLCDGRYPSSPLCEEHRHIVVGKALLFEEGSALVSMPDDFEFVSKEDYSQRIKESSEPNTSPLSGVYFESSYALNKKLEQCGYLVKCEVSDQRVWENILYGYYKGMSFDWRWNGDKIDFIEFSLSKRPQYQQSPVIST